MTEQTPKQMSQQTMDNESQEDPHSPRRGPTLSTSTSSFEALDPHDPKLSNLAEVMFNNTSKYLQGELDSVLEDYSLLSQMNAATAEKYSDLRQVTGSVARSLGDLNDKYLSLQPHLDQIDQIEESVVKLEEITFQLDDYVKRLEEKFRQLEKR